MTNDQDCGEVRNGSQPTPSQLGLGGRMEGLKTDQAIMLRLRKQRLICNGTDIPSSAAFYRPQMSSLLPLSLGAQLTVEVSSPKDW